MIDLPTAAAAAGLVLVMEFADKTQLAVMSLSARTGRFLPVAIGAASALVLLTLLAAAAGGALTHYLPRQWLSLAASLGFMAFGLYMLARAFRGGGHATDATAQHGPGAPVAARRPAWRDAAVAFGLVFVAELGDKSQLAVIGLAADTGRWVPVFAGAALGLTIVTVAGALAGSVALRLVPPRVMRYGPGTVFLTVGALSLAGVL